MNYNCVLLDFDDTLVSFKESAVHSVSKVYNKYNIPVTEENIRFYYDTNESLWRELSVAMLLVSQAVRPYLGIRHAVKRWKTIVVALAERPRSHVNMIAVSI